MLESSPAFFFSFFPPFCLRSESARLSVSVYRFVVELSETVYLGAPRACTPEKDLQRVSKRPATARSHTQSTWTRRGKGSFYTRRLRIYKEIQIKKMHLTTFKATFFHDLMRRKVQEESKFRLFWSTDEAYQTHKQLCWPLMSSSRLLNKTWRSFYKEHTNLHHIQSDRGSVLGGTTETNIPRITGGGIVVGRGVKHLTLYLDGDFALWWRAVVTVL